MPSYYLHYFYAHDRVLAEQRDGVPRATTVAEIEDELLELYRDPALTEKPALLEQRGGAFYSEAAIGLLGALSRTGARRTSSTCGTTGAVAGPRRRRRGRGPGARRPAAGSSRSRSSRSRRSCSGSSST